MLNSEAWRPGLWWVLGAGWFCPTVCRLAVGSRSIGCHVTCILASYQITLPIATEKIVLLLTGIIYYLLNLFSCYSTHRVCPGLGRYVSSRALPSKTLIIPGPWAATSRARALSRPTLPHMQRHHQAISPAAASSPVPRPWSQPAEDNSVNNVIILATLQLTWDQGMQAEISLARGHSGQPHSLTSLRYR